MKRIRCGYYGGRDYLIDNGFLSKWKYPEVGDSILGCHDVVFTCLHGGRWALEGEREEEAYWEMKMFASRTSTVLEGHYSGMCGYYDAKREGLDPYAFF